MKDTFKAVGLSDRVWWVGAIDWPVRDFHGYRTSRGTTYNAYLILADKITLVDTVKSPFVDEMMARIASVVEPARIDYIVSNHSEPDHSGSLPQTISAVSPEKTFASVQGARALNEHFGIGEAITAVEDGQTLSLGNMTLIFAETRMCHWPDSMVTYLAEDAMLFSQDAFGMHLASYERFADELDARILAAEAAKYYANILMPLSKFVAQALDKVAATGWKLKTIAPDHGPIWRTNPAGIIGDYARWAGQERTNKAVVIYDTMWRSTDWMARAVGEGLAAGGTQTRLMPLGATHRSDIATEMLDAGALLVGTPTINNDIFPTVADCLTYLRGLRPQGLIGAAFGSYGWGSQAIKKVTDLLDQMNVELVAEAVRSRYVPDPQILHQCYQLGLDVAERLA